jgi:hypothetical protein
MTMLSRIETMDRFIADFRALRAAQREARLGEMKAFFATFEATHRRVWRAMVDFNVFSLLGVRTDEVRHSGVLAWLLDTESGHGQGDAFMRAFADLCCLDVPPKAFDRYRVRTEFVGTESIIDMTVFRRGEFLIYVENKVFAGEGIHQIDREFRDMRRLGIALEIPKERQFAVFLTPDGRPPLSGDATRWRTVSYGEIAAAFGNLLPGITSTKVKIFLKDWIDTISTFGGTNELVI